MALLCLVGIPLTISRAESARLTVLSGVLGVAVGSVVVSWLMVICSLLQVRWNLALLTAAGLLVSLLLARLEGVSRSVPTSAITEPADTTGGSRWIDVLAVTAILAALACTVFGRASSPDLLYFWGPKAERFGLVRGIDADFLKRPNLEYMHRSYPPLVPHISAWLSLAAGRFSWHAATLGFPLLLLGLWLGLRSLLARIRPPGESSLLAGVATAGVALIGIRTMFGGIGEMPLLLFEGLGVALLCGAAARKDQLLAGICLAGAASTKVEGIAVVAPVVLAFSLLQPRGTRLGALVRTAAPTVIALSAWFLFGRATDLFRSYEHDRPLGEVEWMWLPSVGRELWRAVSDNSLGLPYWLPLVGLFGARWHRRMLVPLSALVGLLGFAFFVYLSAATDPSRWISWSAARVLSPIPVLAAILVATGIPRAQRAGRSDSTSQALPR
jgi:hypothetical protein